MHHGREESGRLGVGGHLTRHHPPQPSPSPLLSLSPSPSPSDEATSPLTPPPPRDAALPRLTPPPPSRPTPPRRTGCHLLRPVVILRVLLGLRMLIGLVICIYKSVTIKRVRVLKTIVGKEDKCLLEEMDFFWGDMMVSTLQMLVIIAFCFYRVPKINQRNTHYDIPNHQDECSSQGSSDLRLSELYQWKQRFYKINRDIRRISARVSKDLRDLNVELLLLKYRMKHVLREDNSEDDSIVPRFLRWFWG